MKPGVPQGPPVQPTDVSTRTENAIHIVCSMYNGAEFLREFVHSVQQQTVTNWLMWIRDDGSRDASLAILHELASGDERVRVLQGPRGQLGVVPSFAWLLKSVPQNARYIMFADQDDVWLPQKIEYTLAAMMAGEAEAGGELLVHTDMVVVDAALNVLDPSFWQFASINPQANTLRELVSRSLVTGATMMINRALRERMGDIPAEAGMHDWWIACVASICGSLIAVSTPTMLYRQHGSNTIGARQPGSFKRLRELPGVVAGALRRSPRVRSDIALAARQARALLSQFSSALDASDRAFLATYAEIPSLRFLRRKLAIARFHLHPGDGMLKNAGLLLRA